MIEGRLNPNAGVCFRALQRGWEDAALKGFYAECFASLHRHESRNPLACFPEFIIADVDVPFLMPYPTISELDVYEINRTYAAKILQSMEGIGGEVDGKDLEGLPGYFLNAVPGFEVRSRTRTADTEYDGIVRNHGQKQDFRAELGFYLIVECKQWKKTIGVPEVSQFINKLLLQDCCTGILFSSRGISGERDNRYARLQVLKAHYRAGRVILVLDKSDFEEVAGGANLISVLRRKYEELRFDIPERSPPVSPCQ